MKLLSVLLIPLLLSTAVHASSESCDSLADAAKNIMIMRQAGTSAQTLMQQTVGLPPNTQAVLKQVIMTAYARPAMSLPENRIKVTDEFVNEWYLACLRGSK